MKDIREFFAYAEALGLHYMITIVGHADASGSSSQNLQISRKRGEAFRDLLVKHRLPKEKFVVIGVGTSEPVREEITDSDRIFNRSVTFRPVQRKN